VLALLVWTLGMALILLVAGGGGARVQSRALHRSGLQRLKRPELLSLKYGRFRPRGAPQPYFALKLTARVPGGQVVELQYCDERSGQCAIADGGCGLGGRKNGGVETFYIPAMPRLAEGVHRVHVTVVASSCNRGNETRQASRAFRLVVR
jgi:hypothetical protein